MGKCRVKRYFRGLGKKNDTENAGRMGEMTRAGVRSGRRTLKGRKGSGE